MVQDKPKKLVLTAKQPFWLVRVPWDYGYVENEKAVRATSERFLEAYGLWCTKELHEVRGSLAHKIYSVLSETHHETKYRNRLIKAINSGGGIIPPSGDYMGLAISFKSHVDAKKKALEAQQAYKMKKERERAKAVSEKSKQTASLDKISAADRKKKVYYHFKQDYDYRGLDETFKGSMTIGQLIDIFKARLTEDYDLNDELIKKHFGEGVITHSMDEWMEECKPSMITNLLKGKAVTGAGEIGVEAFAKTAKQARDAAAQEFLKWEDFE